MRAVISAVAILAAFAVSPALAEEQAKQEPVRIEMDQDAKAFVFMIDNEPVAMLDKTGLRVVSGIEYGYTLTDTGPDWIKDKIATRGKEAADE